MLGAAAAAGEHRDDILQRLTNLSDQIIAFALRRSPNFH
jgi:hypothetical protein